MSDIKCDPEEIGSTIENVLKDFSDDVTAKTKASVDKVSDETKEIIDDHAEKSWKHYRKAFKLKKGYKETALNKANLWYVAAPYYRLTHLLEKGHATRNGGRTRNFPHVQYGEEWAKKRLPEEIEKRIENG